MIEREEFEAWLEEPITRLFLQALENYASEARHQHQQATWAGRYHSAEDQSWLAHLKGRCDTAEFFAEMDFDDLKSCFFEEE